MPANTALTIWRGRTFTAVFPMQDAAGAARDVTGSTFEMVIKPASGSTITLTSSPSAGISVNEAGGIVTVTLSKTASAALPAAGTPATYALDETLPAPGSQRELRAYGAVIIADAP